MAKVPKSPKTVRQTLCWSYANLAMAHAAITAGAQEYSVRFYSIRSRMNKGLLTGVMKLGSLVDDDRLKLLLPRSCCYCGADGKLTVDHLIPTKLGGPDSGDNIVWACGSCNSSKGGKDLLVWFAQRGEFPPLLLLRRYLKLAFVICEERGVMDLTPDQLPPLPFEINKIPQEFPAPSALRLWVVPLENVRVLQIADDVLVPRRLSNQPYCRHAARCPSQSPTATTALSLRSACSVPPSPKRSASWMSGASRVRSTIWVTRAREKPSSSAASARSFSSPASTRRTIS
jgi:hypothetical protein